MRSNLIEYSLAEFIFQLKVWRRERHPVDFAATSVRNALDFLAVAFSSRERTEELHLAMSRVGVGELPGAVQAGKIGGNGLP